MSLYHFSQSIQEYIPFPEINHGAQFRVYDMHNGSVLKIPLTEAETLEVAKGRRNSPASKRPMTEQMVLAARVQTFMNGKARIAPMVEHRFTAPNQFLELLGNPKLISVEDILPQDQPGKRWGAGRIVYTQDKVLMVHEILEKLSLKPSLQSDDVAYLKQIIDAYVAASHALWSYGYAEYAFKFGDTGFDRQGRLIFVDLGECTSDMSFMERALEQERWRNNVDPSKADFPQLPLDLHDYFIHKMTSELNAEKLKKLWRSKHICTTCQPHDDIIRTFIAAKVAEIDYIDRW